MKNSANLGGCYPPRPLASVDNTLLDLQNSSYPTQPHSVIAKYHFRTGMPAIFNPCQFIFDLNLFAFKFKLHDRNSNLKQISV